MLARTGIVCRTKKRTVRRKLQKRKCHARETSFKLKKKKKISKCMCCNIRFYLISGRGLPYFES